MYCASSGHDCRITMQRKQRPFYYASEEQYRWLQMIAAKINPDADVNDIEQLKGILRALDRMELVEREGKEDGLDGGGAPSQSPDSSGVPIEPEEGMDGDVDGIGTLMTDP